VSATPGIRQTARVPRISLPTWRPDRLKAARARKGWTIAQLAATADISFSAASAYSRGLSSPPPEVLVRLAQVLEVATTDLAPLSDTPRLHELRWHAGLSVTELAARLELSPEYTSQILRGEVRMADPHRWAHALVVGTEAATAAWEASHHDLNRRP
jgi:transcriptional regulator with XRE-family HTH domain